MDLDIYSLFEKGLFSEVIKNLENKLLSIEEKWLLIESYLELQMITETEQILKTINNNELEEKENIKFNYLKCFLLRVKGEYDDCITFLQKFISQIDQTQGSQVNNFHYLLSMCYWKKGNLTKALKTSKDILKQIECNMGHFDNEIIMSKVYNLIGNIYVDQGKYSNALEYYYKGRNIFFKIGSLNNLAITNNNIAVIYTNLGEYDNALEFFFNSLRVREKLKNLGFLSDSMSNIGVVYAMVGQFDKALEFHNKSLTIRESLGNLDSISTSLNNIANVFTEQGRLKEAIDYHNRALSIRKKIGNAKSISSSLNNLGTSHEKLGKFDEAIAYFLESLEYAKKVGNDLLKSELVINIIKAKYNKGSLKKNDKILEEFPSKPYESKTIESFAQISEAIFHQLEKNYGLAKQIWEEVLKIETTPYEYQIFGFEVLLELELNEWKISSNSDDLQVLISRIEDWESICQKKSLLPSLCKVLLIKSKIYVILFEFEKSEKYLHQAIEITEKIDLHLHKKFIEYELNRLSDNKDEILKLASKIKEKFKNAELNNIISYIKDLDKIISEKSD